MARRTKIVTFHLSEAELEMLDRVAKSLGTSRSEIIRSAIRLFIMEYRQRLYQYLKGQPKPPPIIRKITLT